MASACDSVMDCDAVLLLNTGVGDYTTTTEKDGLLNFNFPGTTRPANVKLSAHDQTLTPWLRQAEKGVIHSPKDIEGASAPKDVYTKYFSKSADRMLDGENLIVTSYGGDKTRKTGLVLGDETTPDGIVHHFIEGLFKCDGTHHHDTRLTAYAYKPTGDVLTDLIPDDGGKCYFKEADAKRAGTDLLGLQATMLKDMDNARVELKRIQNQVQALRQKEIDAVEKRAEEMGLKMSHNEDEVDLGFDSSPTNGDKKKVESYIPEPFHDQMIVVTVTTYAGELSVLSDRKSSQWGSATFIILPDAARPEAVGALRQDDVVRYERVQKLLCALLAVQTAIRLKRRRIPFLAHRYTSTMRIAYRQTGEREGELQLIRNASFRSKHQAGSNGSPTASPRYTGKDAPVSRSVVLLHLTSKGDNVMENFHSFTCAKRFTEMQGANQGLFSRHLNVEQSQMDREIASLVLQLEVAKQVHSYKPLLFGVESKKESKTIVERENAALKRKEGIIAAAAAEREERIKTAAQHIAERNIKEEKARCAQIQKEYSDSVAKKKRCEEELHKWRTMSVADLNNEIVSLTKDLAAVEKKGEEYEKAQAALKKTVEAKQKEIGNVSSQLAEKQRKAMAEIERRKNEARKVSDARKQSVKTAIQELRDMILMANSTVKDTAEKLVSVDKSSAPYVEGLKQSIAGLEGVLERLMPGEPTDSQLQRAIAVKDRLVKQWTHELLYMQRALRQAGIPLPLNASANPNSNIPLDALRPVVRVQLTFEGMAGVSDGREMMYSIAAVRGGKVTESPRITVVDKMVTWNYKMQFTTRLPAPGTNTVDLLSLSVTEFLPDGSFAESLPFDIDLTALACKAPKKYVIMPCNESDFRVCFHATTRHLRLKRAKANPLQTAKQVKQHVPVDGPYGPSSDEEC